MRPQQLAVFIAILTLIALGVVFAPFVSSSSVVQKLRPKLGLDIQGGARVVLKAETAKLPQGQKWDQNTRNAVKNILENRVNASGVAEPVITTKGEDQFVVEIPAVKNEREILEQIQNTAQLQFFYSPDWKTQRNSLGRYDFVPEGGESGQREMFRIQDLTTRETFRDPFHLNLALRELLDRGAAAGEKAQEVPLPDPLPTLSAAAAEKTVRVDPEDVKKLDELAQEFRSFNAFLSQAKLMMDGSDLLPTARGGFNPAGGSSAVVDLEFDREGKDKFADFTRDHTGEILMIYLDGRILMAPNINEPILNGRAQISPFATVAEAKQLADYLNGGALPVPLSIIQQQSVEPTLGRDAVRAGFVAGLVGLGAVMVYMCATYLLPGVIACFALLLYTLFTYAIFLLIPVTFTLPGIAGFILSIGMAIDANVLIFERTKEELRAGRGLRQAIETGFQRAFSAIFDSNVCTAITSLLLYNFGTGPVRGFALTLLIGVAVSMFTAITVTRTILLLMVRSNREPNLNAWGVNRNWQPKFNFIGNRARYYLLSFAIIVPGLVFAFMGGFKPGIDFTGGSELTLRFTKPVTRAEVERAVAGAGIEDPAAQIAGENTVYVRLPRQAEGEVTAAQSDRIVEALRTVDPGVTREGFETIGSAISAELTRNAFLSIFLSSLFIVLYLAFRFSIGGFANGIKFGVCAVIAMLHDVFVVGGLFAILGYFLNWKVDLLFVTAMLTIIGFSVHDTIVIFDRIRENLRHRARGEAFDDLVNRSINESFVRSVNTSITVMITLLALLVLGGPVIRPLNAALLLGILSGTYSSIFNAAALVVDWERLFGGRQGAPSLAMAGAGAAAGGGGGRPPQPAYGPRPATTPTPKPPVTPRSAGGTTASGADGATGSPGRSSDGQGNYGSRPAPPPGPPRPRRRRM